MFEEWLEGLLTEFEISEEEQLRLREAYKLGLQRGHDGVHDSVVCVDNILELAELAKEETGETT